MVVGLLRYSKTRKSSFPFEGGAMSSTGRRGSVTVILQNASSYCLVTGPREPAELQPDCWDEGTGKSEQKAPSQEGDAPEEEETEIVNDGTNLSSSTLEGKKKEEPTEVEEKKASSSPKRKEGFVIKREDSKRKERQKVEESAQLLDGDEKVYDLMVGRSEVYSQVVEVLRKSCRKSEVLLGLPESPKEHIVLREFSLDESVHKINRSTFTVAIAAAKMRLHYERSLALKSRHKRHDRGKHGKKIFEDAFVTTWSQPILSASKHGFSITFEKTKKPRIVRVSKLRRKSVAIELPKPAEDEAPLEEAEWVEWRRVHDRVTNWLTDNSQVEADESHVIAMLMETDQKKSIFLK